MQQRKHFEGYERVYEAVGQMTEAELYEQLDVLYGRDHLPEQPTITQLRAEVYRQVDLDWTDPSFSLQ